MTYGDISEDYRVDVYEFMDSSHQIGTYLSENFIGPDDYDYECYSSVKTRKPMQIRGEDCYHFDAVTPVIL